MINNKTKKWAYLVLFVFIIACKNKMATSSTIDIIAGTYTNNESKGIYRLTLDTITGKISNKGLLTETSNPSYLTFSKNKNMLYCVNEEATYMGKPSGGITSFQWDNIHKTLTKLNYQSSEGEHPCYISLDKEEKYLSVSNYSSGNIGLFSLGKTNEIKSNSQIRNHTGSGPNLIRQEGPHAHCSLWNPNNEYLYAVDLGTDEVLAYKFNAQLGTIIDKSITVLKTTDGAGPRHLVFHPKQNLAFLVNELNSTILSMTYTSDNPKLLVIDKKSTLPIGFNGNNSVAHVSISPNGKFVYVSNRGHNSIAAFSISETGKITLVDHQFVKGDWPRFFTISPDGKYLLIANENTNNVAVFKIDKTTGKLIDTGYETEVYNPVCLVFP